jgi:RHS repeat-associated protein
MVILFRPFLQYVPDSEDRYNSINGRAIGYDQSGNLIDDGINKYRYDAYNRLAEINTQSGLLKLLRDAIARQVRVEYSDHSEEFTYAGPNVIEWRKNGIVNGQIVPLERPHQYAHVASNGSDSTPLFNMMDSILGWVKSDGSITGATVYDPFGGILESDPNSPASLGFAGYWYENLSGTYQLLARSYQPNFGRFLERDPLGFVDGFNLYAYCDHSPGSTTDDWGFSSNAIDWATVASEGLWTLGKGVLFIGGATLAVTTGMASLPFVATLATVLLIGQGIMSFFKRADEAFDAGKTDFQGRAALAALGDSLGSGATNIYEGVTGRDFVTDRVLGIEDRSARLGGGLVGVVTTVAGGTISKFASSLAPRVNQYTIPSISRPSYHNPIIFGRYVSPEGVVWEGNVFRGFREGIRTWRSGGAFSEGLTSTRGAGSYWHVRAHFQDMPASGGPHGIFDPSFRNQMVLLGDAPYIAGRGTSVNVGGIDILPEKNLVDIRAFYPQSPNRGGAFIFTEPNTPPIGVMGGNPPANWPPVGSSLTNGYRVIVEPSGAGRVRIVTMFPQ